MEEDRSHMTARILNLTLEILYLLTGESLPPRKPDEHLTITVPPSHAMNPERHNMEKILEVTKKIIELLTGEMNGDGNYKSRSGKEEWEDLEGHKDLYKDVMMEDEPDGSRKRNPPQRCPRPLEDLPIPCQDQGGDFGDYNIVIKEEYKEEDEEYGVMKECSEEHTDLKERCPLYSRDPPQEAVPIPRQNQGEDPMKMKVEGEEETYVRDDQRSTEEAGMMRTSKEEAGIMRTSIEEAGVMRIVIKEDTSTEISTGPVTTQPSTIAEDQGDVMENSSGAPQNTMEPPKTRTERGPRPRDSTPDGDSEPHHEQNGDLDEHHIIIKEEPTEEDDEYGVMNDPQTSPRPLYSPESSEDEHAISGEDVIAVKVVDDDEVEEEEDMYDARDDEHYTAGVKVTRIVIEEDGVMRTIKVEDTPTEIGTGHALKKLSADQLTLSLGCTFEEKGFGGPRNPSEAQQPPTVKEGAAKPKRIRPPGYKRYTGEKLHPCPDCGKLFATKSLVVRHQRTHTGEKPYSCLACGKSYSQTSQLLRHQRMHTGDKPYGCPECGKCFPVKYELIAHQRSHLPDKPYSCPECGKSYPRKLHLVRHQRSHTGLKPHFCTVCGKCFKEKSHLYTHLKTHTSEKPFACTECGKCFKEKYHLNSHWKIHKGEKSFACPDCGKGFLTQAHLNRHMKMHSGEKPYFCPDCGKSFSRKSYVVRHQRSHANPEEQ